MKKFNLFTKKPGEQPITIDEMMVEDISEPIVMEHTIPSVQPDVELVEEEDQNIDPKDSIAMTRGFKDYEQAKHFVNTPYFLGLMVVEQNEYLTWFKSIK